MEITHESLLALGFTELFNHPTRYQYKNITGRLNPDGTFRFHGFTPVIKKLIDIKYMIMVIDYQHQPVAAEFKVSDN